MRKNIYYFIFIFIFSGLIFSSCQKDSLSPEEKEISSVNIYPDSTIILPVEVVAGQNCLLSAYFTNKGKFNFILTDNNGKFIWEKQFGITQPFNSNTLPALTAMLAESDGTFTVFNGDRLINFDKDGVVLRDIPDFLSSIPANAGSSVSGHRVIHVFQTKNGNYFFYGSYTVLGTYYGFAAEINHTDGTLIFRKVFEVHTQFTGCQMTPDGGYLLLGARIPASFIHSTRFVLLKLAADGTTLWSKKYALDVNLPLTATSTSINNLYTHEIVETNDGNYLCFISSPSYLISDQKTRVYKISPDGVLMDSVFININNYNIIAGGRSQSASTLNPTTYANSNGYGVIEKDNGNIRVYMQSDRFNVVQQTASIVNGVHTFYSEIDQDLNIIHSANVQNAYYDNINSVCKTSDGKIASFGLITSFGFDYKPVLIITD
jgi:hypothetical protein